MQMVQWGKCKHEDNKDWSSDIQHQHRYRVGKAVAGELRTKQNAWGRTSALSSTCMCTCTHTNTYAHTHANMYTHTNTPQRHRKLTAGSTYTNKVTMSLSMRIQRLKYVNPS